MPLSASLRFAFLQDGRLADHQPPDMSVTYIGRISRKQAEADARRRFEEWRSQPNALARRWSSDQIVLG